MLVLLLLFHRSCFRAQCSCYAGLMIHAGFPMLVFVRLYFSACVLVLLCLFLGYADPSACVRMLVLLCPKHAPMLVSARAPSLPALSSTFIVGAARLRATCITASILIAHHLRRPSIVDFIHRSLSSIAPVCGCLCVILRSVLSDSHFKARASILALPRSAGARVLLLWCSYADTSLLVLLCSSALDRALATLSCSSQ